MYLYAGQKVIYNNSNRVGTNPWVLSSGFRVFQGQVTQVTRIESSVVYLDFGHDDMNASTTISNVIPLYPAGKLVRFEGRNGTIVEENDSGGLLITVYFPTDPCHRKVPRSALDKPMMQE